MSVLPPVGLTARVALQLDNPPAMARDGKTHRRSGRVNLVPAFVLIGLVFIAIGAIPLVTGLPGQLESSAMRYDSASNCGPYAPGPTVSRSTSCRFQDSGTVTQESTSTCGRYATCYNVVVVTSSGLTSTTGNETLYYEVAVGSTYPVEIWQSKITCIFVQPGVCTQTGDNPDLVASNNSAVWMLLIIGVGLLFAVPPLAYEFAERRRRWQKKRPSQTEVPPITARRWQRPVPPAPPKVRMRQVGC